MAGIHIAEALKVPYFRAFTMPWTQTRSYPHAFTVPNQKQGGNYNYITYLLFENSFWLATSRQINHWRRCRLGLPPTNLEKLQQEKVPFLYNFSPSVVPHPLDFPHWIHTTGYWFLDESLDYEPPQELTDFIAKARSDSKKLVYVGFGSIVVEDSVELTQIVVDAVLKADIRCVLSKGWSDRLDKAGASRPEVAIPSQIIQIKSAPHDWLFREMDAVVHHGGAGTTGAGLRAGLPTVIKPFFGDQFFSAQRVEDLGVGTRLRTLSAPAFAKALWEVTNDERMIRKAKDLGEKIRWVCGFYTHAYLTNMTKQEPGVHQAIETIYRDLEYARSLIKPHVVPGREVEEEAEVWEMVDSGPDSDHKPWGEYSQAGDLGGSPPPGVAGRK